MRGNSPYTTESASLTSLAINLHNSTLVLSRYCYNVILRYYNTTILRYYNITILRYCYTAISSYHHIIISSYHYIIISQYCRNTILQWPFRTLAGPYTTLAGSNLLSNRILYTSSQFLISPLIRHCISDALICGASNFPAIFTRS